jgi:recombinational DNA repair protein RecR
MSVNTEMKDRAQRAARIAKNPRGYKVCEGCESIVTEKSITCPNCHGYRFDNNAIRVVTQARLLGSRPATSITMKDLE